MLRTLLALTRHGTITATAEAVALTPAAVSQQMAQLEAELGPSIFDRRGKAVRLNANGHRVVEGASQIVQIYETLQTQAGPESLQAGSGWDRLLPRWRR